MGRHQIEFEAIRYLNSYRDLIAEPGTVDLLVKRFGLYRYEAEELVETVVDR